MQIAAVSADNETGCREVTAGIVLVPNGHHHAVNLISGSLMVDESSGPELGDGEESRPGDELLVVLRRTTSGDESRERKPREVIARQETFACEIAIAVEVGLDGTLAVRQQPELGFSLLTKSAGHVVLHNARRIADDPVGVVKLGASGPIEILPARQRALEGYGDSADHFVQPAFGIPRGVDQVILHVRQHGGGAGPCLRKTGGPVKFFLFLGQQFQRGLVAVQLHQLAGGISQIHAALLKPDGVNVGTNQVFVCHINAWGLNLAGYHQLWLTEEILVMRTAERAIGEDQGGLPAAPGATTSLGVVGRSRRNVSHIHDVQVADIDAQFHGG